VARPFTSTISFDDAMRIVMAAAAPIARTERVPIEESLGRVAGADVAATVDVPPFDRAAMDGYAVIAADTSGATRDRPRLLTLAGRVFTGDVPCRPLAAGECMEIATGAPMPQRADAVVMVEETARAGDRVEIRTAVQPRQHVGPRAADLAAGHTVVTTGQILNPSRIGALAATGVDAVTVFAKPAVAVLSTGNEIVAPGQALAAGQIYDVNRFTLDGVIRGHGGVPVPMPVTADSVDDLLRVLDTAIAHDIVVFSGGSSVGDRDLIRDALEARGTVHFHGVAVKPGKPTAFATVGPSDRRTVGPSQVPVFAMPGYPTSCLSNAYMFLVPFLRRIARLPPWEPRTMEVRLSRRVTSAPGRLQFYTVRVIGDRAEPAFKASGDITSMADADGYFEIPADTEFVEAGTLIRVTLF
jgi:molybdopterin molybdotransferase